MVSEFGSEFWLDYQTGIKDCFVLSGRTAIDLILQDIFANGKNPKSVYMPAWCCDSMLLPFVDKNIGVDFYDIAIANGKLEYLIDMDFQPDILYVTNYFGYGFFLPQEIILRFKEKGTIILYDHTHSLFREKDIMISQADYTFASIRKWLGVPCGAFVSKKDGKIENSNLKDCPYLDEKIEAMKLKAAYMQNHQEELKSRYLELYASFGHHLSADYQNYQMDQLSKNIWNHVDKQSICEVRRRNALMLQKSLEATPQVQLMFNIEESDCPLFVPILFDTKEERDRVRKELTANAIYCPIHWPKPKQVNGELSVNSLYDRELSLICDQRYGIEDMHHIICVLENILEK
jgi:hypothetical protein